jgi:hypothetical protein
LPFDDERLEDARFRFEAERLRAPEEDALAAPDERRRLPEDEPLLRLDPRLRPPDELFSLRDDFFSPSSITPRQEPVSSSSIST